MFAFPVLHHAECLQSAHNVIRINCHFLIFVEVVRRPRSICYRRWPQNDETKQKKKGEKSRKIVLLLLLYCVCVRLFKLKWYNEAKKEENFFNKVIVSLSLFILFFNELICHCWRFSISIILMNNEKTFIQ